MTSIKKRNIQAKSATIVASLVIIAAVIYGIRSKKKWGYYMLVSFVLAPAAGWLTFAATGPMVEELPEEIPAEEPTKEEPTKDA